MRNSAIPLALLLSLLACDQQTVAPVMHANPDFAVAANADIDKNMVLRYQDHLAVSWTDPTNGLRATHTTFPIPFGGQPETDCGPQNELAGIDFRQVGVIDPVDFFASELHLNASGPVWVIVRDMNQAGDCYGAKLVAEGLGSIQYNDNDAFGALPGETEPNVWGFSASGALTTPDGRQVDYQGTARYIVWPTPGEPTFKPAVEQVRLR